MWVAGEGGIGERRRVKNRPLACPAGPGGASVAGTPSGGKGRRLRKALWEEVNSSKISQGGGEKTLFSRVTDAWQISRKDCEAREKKPPCFKRRLVMQKERYNFLQVLVVLGGKLGVPREKEINLKECTGLER